MNPLVYSRNPNAKLYHLFIIPLELVVKKSKFIITVEKSKTLYNMTKDAGNSIG
jgi:hypothetical protein